MWISFISTFFIIIYYILFHIVPTRVTILSIHVTVSNVYFRIRADAQLVNIYQRRKELMDGELNNTAFYYHKLHSSERLINIKQEEVKP